MPSTARMCDRKALPAAASDGSALAVSVDEQPSACQIAPAARQ
jgi:hypothetical protein